MAFRISPQIPVGGDAVAFQYPRGRRPKPGEIQRDRGIFFEHEGDVLILAVFHHLDCLLEVAHLFAVDRKKHARIEVLIADVDFVRQHLRQKHHLFVGRGIFPADPSRQQRRRIVLAPFEEVAVRKRSEDQSSDDVVLRAVVIEVRRHLFVQFAYREFRFHYLAVAQQRQLDLVAYLLCRGDGGEVSRLAVRQTDVAVIGDLFAVDGEDNVAYFQCVVIGSRIDFAHHDPGLVGTHLQIGAGVGIVQRDVAESHQPEAVHFAVLDVIEEVPDYVARDHVAQAFPASVPLKRDPDDFAVEEDRTARVAGVDRRVDLRREQPFERVGVTPDLDARDYPLCERDAIAPDREARRDHLRLCRRRLAELQRSDVGKEFGIVDRQQREVAVVIDELDLGDEQRVVVLLADGDERTVRHVVSVGQDHAAADHRPGTRTGTRQLALPRQPEIRDRAGDLDLDHRVQRIIPVLCCRQRETAHHADNHTQKFFHNAYLSCDDFRGKSMLTLYIYYKIVGFLLHFVRLDIKKMRYFSTLPLAFNAKRYTLYIKVRGEYMIADYKSEETRKLKETGHSRKFQAIERLALRKLDMLEAVITPDALRIPPSNHFEALHGDREGQYSIRINLQWRICFTWRDGNAHDVEIVDYH